MCFGSMFFASFDTQESNGSPAVKMMPVTCVIFIEDRRLGIYRMESLIHGLMETYLKMPIPKWQMYELVTCNYPRGQSELLWN